VTQNKEQSVMEMKRQEKRVLSQLPEDIFGEHQGLTGLPSHPHKKRIPKGLSLLLKLINF